MRNSLLSDIVQNKQHFKYLHYFGGLYLFGLMTSMTVSARLQPFIIPYFNYDIHLTAGTWTIPFTFFILDIVTEVYGYSKARNIVIFSTLLTAMYVGYLQLTTNFPIPDVIANIPKNTIIVDDAYNTIANALPRHLFAFVMAILIASIANNKLLSKLKTWLQGRYLPFRFIASTALGEALLQIVGTTIAWYGGLDFYTEILPFVAFSYFYKITFEALMTPLNTSISGYLKNAEGIDVYDN